MLGLSLCVYNNVNFFTGYSSELSRKYTFGQNSGMEVVLVSMEIIYRCVSDLYGVYL
jgi:hypothetical protein